MEIERERMDGKTERMDEDSENGQREKDMDGETDRLDGDRKNGRRDKEIE